MQNQIMDLLPSILFFLGMSFFCGILPLLFAALTFFSAKKRGELGGTLKKTKLQSVSTLQPGQGMAKVSGKIHTIGVASGALQATDFALLRLRVEVYEANADDRMEWRPSADKQATSPFLLDDGSGQIWINPEQLDKTLLGEGVVPSQEQLDLARILLEVNPGAFIGQHRVRLWELRKGQNVTAVGPLVQHAGESWIARQPGQPLVVSSLSPDQVLGETSQQAKKARLMTALLGIPGALCLLSSCIGLIIMGVRLIK